MTGDTVLAGDALLAAVPRQRQAAVVAVRSDPLSSPLSLMVLEAPARPATEGLAQLSRLLPIQRDRRLRSRGVVGALLALAVAGGFATAMWVLIAGSAVALGRTL